MAELSTETRQKVWRGFMRYLSRLRQPLDLNKSELQAAVNATDTWIDDNQASFNSALPAAAQSGLTIMQKTLLFCGVALARVNVSLLVRIFGEVD